MFLVTCFATLHPAMSVRWLVGPLVPFWAAVPKGSMTYAFTHMGNIFLLGPLPLGPNPSLEAQILWALGLDLGLEVRIKASRGENSPYV